MFIKKQFAVIMLSCLLVLLFAGCQAEPEIIRETVEVEKVVTQVIEVEKEVTKIVAGTPVVETVVETRVVEQVVTATPEPAPPEPAEPTAVAAISEPREEPGQEAVAAIPEPRKEPGQEPPATPAPCSRAWTSTAALSGRSLVDSAPRRARRRTRCRRSSSRCGRTPAGSTRRRAPRPPSSP